LTFWGDAQVDWSSWLESPGLFRGLEPSEFLFAPNLLGEAIGLLSSAPFSTKLELEM